MADVELLIKISEEEYNFIKRTGYNTQSLYNAIMNSIPLPKGHGKLKDVNTFNDTVMRLNEDGNGYITRNDYKIIDTVLFEMPTIIEADKE